MPLMKYMYFTNGCVKVYNYNIKEGGKRNERYY